MASRQSASLNDSLPSDPTATMADRQPTAASMLAKPDANRDSQFTTTSDSATDVQTTTNLTAEARYTGVTNSTAHHHHQDHPPPITTATTTNTIPLPPPPSSSPPPLTIPHTLFFYGTLQSPTVLQFITRLSSPLPPLEDAHIQGGFDLRLWGGKYPALIPNPASDAIIPGKLWRVGEADGFGAEEWGRLKRYEGGKYEVGECVVRVGAGGVGEEEVRAAVFQWAGNAGSDQLTEGVFDLDAWREKFMGPFFGWFDD